MAFSKRTYTSGQTAITADNLNAIQDELIRVGGAGTAPVADYIVEQGTSGIWTYRKWNSGTAECYGTLSTVPYNCPGYNGFDVSLPFAFSNTSYAVVVQPTINGLLTSYHAIMDSAGNNSKTTTKFILSYDYTSSTSYSVHFDIHVFGRWK